MSPDGGTGPWYREWFGEAYLELYPHRDAEEAGRGVDLFLDLTSPERGSRILDLACGAGRHLGPLEAAGLRPVGLDLSRPLLDRAADGGARRLVRGDMRRLPFRTGAFDGVVQFFTSFGYFDSREGDRRVLEEVRRVLRPGGAFLLDFLNAGKVRREIVPEDVREIEGRTVRQRRWIEGDRVVKEIEIDGGVREDPETFRERVRLYEPDELVSMLEEADLRVRERRGDYGGAPFEEEAPRLLLAGEAT